MAITTTCEHIVHSIDDVYDLQIKGYNEIGDRVVLYQCFCIDCANEKIFGNEVIHNQQEEYDWINGISEDPLSTLLECANKLKKYPDNEVSSFASRVSKLIESNNNDHKLVVVRIDTNDDFTLSLKDSLVTGVGKIIFGSITEAILCLNSAHITWQKDKNTNLCYTFLQFCNDASLSLKQGNTSFVKQDSSFMLTVEVRK